jgi:NitT/TauT family transport system substrate-binding protein
VVFDKAGNNAFFKKSANITKPQDLVGKKIAVPPADSHRVLWPAFAAINKLDENGVTLSTSSPRASRRSSPRGGGRLLRPLHQLRDLGEGARQG